MKEVTSTTLKKNIETIQHLLHSGEYFFSRFLYGEQVWHKNCSESGGLTLKETHQERTRLPQKLMRVQEIQFTMEWAEGPEWVRGNTPEERLREQRHSTEAGSVSWACTTLPVRPFWNDQYDKMQPLFSAVLKSSDNCKNRLMKRRRADEEGACFE